MVSLFFNFFFSLIAYSELKMSSSFHSFAASVFCHYWVLPLIHFPFIHSQQRVCFVTIEFFLSFIQFAASVLCQYWVPPFIHTQRVYFVSFPPLDTKFSCWEKASIFSWPSFLVMLLTCHGNSELYAENILLIARLLAAKCNIQYSTYLRFPYFCIFVPWTCAFFFHPIAD